MKKTATNVKKNTYIRKSKPVEVRKKTDVKVNEKTGESKPVSKSKIRQHQKQKANAVNLNKDIISPRKAVSPRRKPRKLMSPRKMNRPQSSGKMSGPHSSRRSHVIADLNIQNLL